MAATEAQKRASAKWDKANTKTATCKLRIDEYVAFKAYAERHGKTISAVLLEYVRKCISEDEQCG